MSVRRIRISGEVLNSFLRRSQLWESSLPEDANVVGIAPEDYYARTFERDQLAFAHGSKLV